MRGTDPGYHRVALYRSGPELRITAVPFLRDGLTLGEAAVLAVGPAEARHIVLILGAAAAQITMAPADTYGSPEDAAGAVRRLIAGRLAAGASRVRIVGALPEGFSRAWEPWERYEAEMDRALRELPVTALCLYDAATVPDPIARHVLALHPAIAELFGTSRPNPAYAP